MTNATSAPGDAHVSNMALGVPADRQRSFADRSSVLAAAAVLAFGVLISIHATGMFGDTMYTITIALALLVGMAGIRRNRPQPMWPWRLIILSGVFWGLSSELASYDNFANLTSSRSLIPDLVAIPGYALFGWAILGMLRARRPRREVTLALDGLVIAFGAALLVNHVVVTPTLGIDDAWLPAQLTVAFYPVAAIVILAIAGQLAFSGGHSSPSFFLLLVGTVSLTIGETMWAFAEIGRFELPPHIADTPILVIPATIASAMLHPSVNNVTVTDHAAAPVRSVRRYLLVSSTLIVPPVLIVLPGEITLMTVALSVALCSTSALRVAHAMHTEDRSRAELLHRANHDDLTDLPARPLLLEEIQARLHRSDQPLSLLFIDLDHFKNVNDLMGHQAGDELLMRVASRLADVVRETDLVARISGDEFVVVAHGLDEQRASQLADRIRRTIAKPFDLTAGEILCTASIGVSTARPGADTTPAMLIQEADTAMYESKSTRNGTTVFDQSMQDRATRRMEIERLLRHETDAPRLTPWFQPIIDTDRNHVVGFEALLRWDAMGAPVSPAEFIPIAEESGMIVPIGAFVLDESCRQAAWWRANIVNGQDLSVSVNVSARQIASADIVDTVATCLSRHDLPPSALWLEITETVMTEDTAVTAAAMSGLRMLGVHIALDDFGTGYSSLSGLQYLPVSRLKIDRQFISDLGADSANDKLVRCITAVAESFDLDVVAEGVETKEQLEAVRSFGCSLIQGYLFGRPVPADDVPRVFAELDRRRVPQRRHHRVASR
ncbi:MAG: putative bifunctional diguanylate cyclase/phosphodiesterase [Ilumatobacter sp.]